MSFLKSNLFILISFFPVFALRSNYSFFEVSISFFIFTIPILIINYLLFKTKKNENFFYLIFLSLVIVFGIDNNIGLWVGLINPFTFDLLPIFKIIYIPAFILFILFSVLIFLLIKSKNKKAYDIIFIFFTYNICF